MIFPRYSPFNLKSFTFVGDRTGVLHVGSGQVIVVQHPDDAEFLVNVYVYQGGTLILPESFMCRGINMHIWFVLMGGLDFYIKLMKTFNIWLLYSI